MPQGIEVYDGTGALVFDSTVYIPRILTSVAIGTTDGSTSVSVPAGANVLAETKDSAASVAVSGGTLSWAWGTTPSAYRTADTIDVMIY